MRGGCRLAPPAWASAHRRPPGLPAAAGGDSGSHSGRGRTCPRGAPACEAPHRQAEPRPRGGCPGGPARERGRFDPHPGHAARHPADGYTEARCHDSADSSYPGSARAQRSPRADSCAGPCSGTCPRPCPRSRSCTAHCGAPCGRSRFGPAPGTGTLAGALTVDGHPDRRDAALADPDGRARGVDEWTDRQRQQPGSRLRPARPAQPGRRPGRKHRRPDAAHRLRTPEVAATGTMGRCPA